MKTFDWAIFEKSHTKFQFDYLQHVHNRNIQEVDFIRGYCSLPRVEGAPIISKRRAKKLFDKLKTEFDFFNDAKVRI